MAKRNLYIGFAFIAFGVYEWVAGKPMEMALYSLVGGAFIVTWLSYYEGLAEKWKKPLTVLSWMFILAAGLIFLFLLRTEAWGT